MKIALASDLHLEFGPLEIKNTEDAEVLLLSGDILVAADLYHYESHKLMYDENSYLHKKYNGYRDFFASASREFKQVLWIPGNHEHYHGDVSHTRLFAEQFLRNEKFDNVTYMDRNSVKIGDFTIYGGTLWTNFNKEDHFVMWRCQDGMRDFSVIQNANHELQPRDTVVWHKEFLNDVEKLLPTCDKMIIMGHHAPSSASIHWRYQRPEMDSLNHAYSSDLSNFILDNPKIKLWVHGHVHDNFDYMIGETRIVCNPRGYIGHERRADNYTLQYIDV